jgi:hypothetical protein
VLRQHCAALLDRSDEAVGDPSLAYPCDQRRDRLIPYLRRHFGVDAAIGHDLGIALGGRGKDQHSRPILGLVQALGEELLHGLGMRAFMLGAARHDMEADSRQREPGCHDDEDDELNEIDERGRPEREIDQRRRHGECNSRGPRDRHQAIVARMPRDDAEDFA